MCSLTNFGILRSKERERGRENAQLKQMYFVFVKFLKRETT